jgi:small GTP-binding protein
MDKIGVECYKSLWRGMSSKYLIKIWDTCGQERFRSLTTNYYRHADGIVLVFDINDPDSFDNLEKWVHSVNENIEVTLPKVVIANKTDLGRKITPKSIKQFKTLNKVEVYECSAKTGENSKEAFDYVIKEVIKTKIKKNKFIDISEIEVIQQHPNCTC